jgi:Acetyltransferases, including N-acetylases of ribosomal proteins
MLETTRLKLVPLTHEQLILYKNDPEILATQLGVQYLKREHDPATLNDVAEALEFWIENTLAHRELFEWFTNWEIILKAKQVAIGGIGFAGLPNEEGKSMVGYGLDLRFHGKGYASEALTALLQWGFQNPELKVAIADTPIHHAASQRVLIKNGFWEESRDENLIHWKADRKS